MCMAVAACSTPRTQVTLAVETNLRIPTELDGYSISVVGPDGSPQQASTMVASREPKTLALVHTNGALGPFIATVTGTKSSATVITRSAEFSFVAQETRLLRITLDNACVGVNCAVGQTCSKGSCGTAVVPPSDLIPWDGDPIEVDAGVADGPGDTSMEAGEDMNVPDMNQPDMDVPDMNQPDMDVPNCTAQNCSVPGANTSCIDNECVVIECQSGLGDCDNDLANGCEQMLTARQHCGACGNNCRNRPCVQMMCR